MAGTYPLTPYFNAVSLEQEQASILDRTRNKKKFIRKHDGHIWKIEGTYARKNSSEFLAIYAFLCAREGGANNFTFTPSEHATPQGVASGSPLVNGASQMGSNLIIDGAGASVTGWLKAGDILSVAGHTKVYMVAEDCNSDGSGNVTIPMVNDLIESPDNNAVVTVNNVAFTMFLSDNKVKAGKVPPVLYSGSVEMEEDI